MIIEYFSGNLYRCGKIAQKTTLFHDRKYYQISMGLYILYLSYYSPKFIPTFPIYLLECVVDRRIVKIEMNI